MPGGGCDVGPVREGVQAGGGVAHGGHDVGCLAGAQLQAVFVEGGVSDSMRPVLDSSVSLNPGRQDRRWGGGLIGGGYEVVDLDALSAWPGAGMWATWVAPVNWTQSGLSMALISCDSAPLAVLGAVVARRVGTGPAFARGVRGRLVLLDGKDVVPAAVGGLCRPRGRQAPQQSR